MTVKRRWTEKYPLAGEVRRSKALTSGYSENLTFHLYDPELGGLAPQSRRLAVLSEDAVETELLDEAFRNAIPLSNITVTEGRVTIANFPKINPFETFDREGIRTMIKAEDGEYITDNSEKRVEFDWEPTLPSQSRV